MGAQAVSHGVAEERSPRCEPWGKMRPSHWFWDLHLARWANESKRPIVHPQIHAANAWFLEEAGQPQTCRGTVRCPLQFLPCSRLAQSDASNTSRSDWSHLDDWGIVDL